MRLLAGKYCLPNARNKTLRPRRIRRVFVAKLLNHRPLSSARTRSAQRIATAIKFDGPAQFGMTSAWPIEYNTSAKYIGWRMRR
jgi:hypothetical protein